MSWKQAVRPFLNTKRGSSLSQRSRIQAADAYFFFFPLFNPHNMKHFFTCLALVISALLPLVSQAQFTPDPTHVYRIVSRRTQLALGTYNTDEGARVYQGPLLNNYLQQAGQEWSFEVNAAGNFHIKNRNSGLYLGLADYLFQSGAIYNQYYTEQAASATGAWQYWKITPSRTGSGYEFVSVLYDQNLLYASDDQANVLSSNTLTNASFTSAAWDIIDISKNPPSQVFTLQTNHNAQYLTADLSNNQIRQFSGDGSIAIQQWIFEEYLSDPFGNSMPNVFRIVNRSTGHVIQANGTGVSATSAGTRARSANQLWTLRDVNSSRTLTLAEATDGRSFQIYSSYAGKVLEIENGNQDQGGLAYTNFYRGSPWQQWHVANKTANRIAPGATDAITEEPVVSIYPNPAHNDLTIILPGDATPTMFSVVDQITGQAIKVKQQGNGRIDVSSLAPGMYVLKTSDGQNVYQRKFVKE
jgi:hypothetical protein